jgi:hypothetical protein
MNGESWSRIYRALVSPQKTFREIAERPTWAAALLALVLAGVLASLVISPKLDYAQMMLDAVEERGTSGASEEQLENVAELMGRFGWVMGLLGAVVFQPVGYLLVALLFFLVFKVLGSEMGFARSLAVTVHALLPLLVASLLTVLVVLRREELTLDELRAGLLASNLGVLAPEGAGKLLRGALRHLDFFSLWIMVLFVIGFRAATRLSGSTAVGVVGAVWALWYLGKVGWGALFG